MITCGEALEMVRMAMAEAGFPDHRFFVTGADESDTYTGRAEDGRISTVYVSDRAFRSAFWTATPPPTRCRDCFLSAINDCDHVGALT